MSGRLIPAGWRGISDGGSQAGNSPGKGILNNGGVFLTILVVFFFSVFLSFCTKLQGTLQNAIFQEPAWDLAERVNRHFSPQKKKFL